MGNSLKMRKQDLLELYQLLELYRCTYGDGLADSLIEEVSDKYRRVPDGGDIRVARNPRGAGRRKKYTKTETDTISKMRADGTAIRRIASETGCSVGYVQGVINEQKESHVQKLIFEHT